jgi:hypothetical protein
MFAHHLERHVLDNGFVTLSIPFPSHDERSLAYAESKFRRGHLTRWFFVVNEARRIVLHRSRRAFAVQGQMFPEELFSLYRWGMEDRESLIREGQRLVVK